MEAVFIYVTAPSEEVATSIARPVVEEGLAACANILRGMRSIYRWQGRIEEAEETVLILKTRAALFDALAARVRDLHPYECPCIVALPLAAGTPDYLRWILGETAPSSTA
ncbi:divalent-cation tolerance protein CutA [Arenibaculum pallidiluteum]|uniref:divalent-cation tolerance protein CutA n=1 Tax=Arenibaculum pallidiluteum TaxID=2812559 RepID=UPI001A9724AD|nr:divalent-cation tolerance protein CutA [Arenibaculum pallidiluteum]